MTEMNLSDNAPHEYEVLDKYNREIEYEEVAEVDLTNCPAYVPTMLPKPDIHSVAGKQTL